VNKAVGYLRTKTLLGVGDARRHNTKPAKRLAHKVGRRQAARETTQEAATVLCRHEFRLVGLGSCWRCSKCGEWE
jgi:hypothetical protein